MQRPVAANIHVQHFSSDGLLGKELSPVLQTRSAHRLVPKDRDMFQQSMQVGNDVSIWLYQGLNFNKLWGGGVRKQKWSPSTEAVSEYFVVKGRFSVVKVGVLWVVIWAGVNQCVLFKSVDLGWLAAAANWALSFWLVSGSITRRADDKFETG